MTHSVKNPVRLHPAGLSLIIAACSFLFMGAAVKNTGGKHDNPRQNDPGQELMRLRNEGVAQYESGVGQKKALEFFQGAHKLKPDSVIENFNLGVAYRKLNDIESARKHLVRATELDKNFAAPHYVLGLIHREQNDQQASLASFRRAAELMPNDASVHYQLSRAYREQDKKPESLQATINTLQLDPYHTGALYQLYLYYQQSDEADKADETFKEFSRLKKAFSKTRKEINPDESLLAMPIGSSRGGKTSPFAAKGFSPAFGAASPIGGVSVAAYTVADINNDGVNDYITVSRDGQVSVTNVATGGSAKKEFTGKVSQVNGVNNVQAARLVKGGRDDLLVLADNGLFLVKAAVAEAGGGFDLKNPLRLSTNKHAAAHLLDVDHDGDLDVVAGAFAAVFINDGNAGLTLKEKYHDAELDAALKAFNGDFIGSDFRNIIAVDYLLHDRAGKRALLRDQMGGKYTLENEKTLTAKKDLQWLGKADMDNDGWVDIVTLTGSDVGIDFNSGGQAFTPTVLGDSGNASEAVVADFNNDGLKDIFVGGVKTAGVWINKSNRNFSFEALSAPLTLRNIQAVDYDSNGLLDLVGVTADAVLAVSLNGLQDTGNWLKLKLNGIRSAPDGRFVQVEVYYGSFYSKYESAGGLLHIPLADANYAEILRITWPNGFVESKFKVDAGQSLSFDESERISGSCPSIYSWNGARFEYITDAFISGPMGVPVGQGRYFPVDHDEYVKIPGEQVRIVNGEVHISIVEELKEVTYLDQVRLYAVDHEDSISIFPNEYLNPPEFPEFKIHATRHARPPARAIDHRGNDVLELIERMDYRYPHAFGRLQYTGFSQEQGIELGLSRHEMLSPHLRLFLTGWFYYFDSTSLISASQNSDIGLVWPQVQVYRNGQWETVKRIGIPSGKEKTVVVDLGGVVPADAEKLRVWTNVELYWDRILVDTSEPPAHAYAMSELPLIKSRLRFHGFSKLLRPATGYPMPDRFDFHDVGYQSFWDPLAGKYTRYGDVDELLNVVDSKLAVFGSGDELRMRFDAAALPPLQPGYRRDYLIYLNGYVKDGDKYTAYAGNVEPMPFAGLKGYPFTEADLRENPFAGEDYRAYLRDYQSRDPLKFTRPAF